MAKKHKHEEEEKQVENEVKEVVGDGVSEKELENAISEIEEVKEVKEDSGAKTKIAIKSQEYKPRGKAGIYRSGGVYVVKEAEGKELIDAGIATLLEENVAAELTIPEVE